MKYRVTILYEVPVPVEVEVDDRATAFAAAKEIMRKRRGRITIQKPGEDDILGVQVTDIDENTATA